MTRAAYPVRRCDSERGAALLIIFVIAAIVAITLFMELPVAAFEKQRLREQLLVDRGQEYARAVKLYVRKVGHYPASIKDLENTNNMRFLRSEYPDPFTGKADWRLLHAGPNGTLIDSKVPQSQQLGLTGQNGAQTAAQNGSSSSNTSSFGGNNSSFGGGNTSSFGGSASGSSFGSNQNSNNASNGANSFGNSQSGTGLFSSSDSSSNAPPEVMVLQPRRRGPVVSANGGTNLATNFDKAADDGGLPLPDPDGTGKTARRSSSAGSASGNSFAALGTDANATGTNNAPAAGASNLRSSILGAGAPGSSNFGNSGTTSGFGASQTGVLNSGGLAGVASKAGGHSIKEINEQDDYSKWEFYYDPRKDTAPGGVQAGQFAPQQQASGTTGGVNNGSGFGSSSSFGGSSGFSQGSGSAFGSSNTSGSGAGSSLSLGSGSSLSLGSGSNTTGNSNSSIFNNNSNGANQTQAVNPVGSNPGGSNTPNSNPQ